MPRHFVKYGKAGAIATITLDRPEKFNARRGGMVRGIEQALKAANRDDHVRVIVLEGAGDHFCAGADFSDGLEHVRSYKEDG
jgi:enoyl-CoA hydratase/carnithine racemase